MVVLTFTFTKEIPGRMTNPIYAALFLEPSFICIAHQVLGRLIDDHPVQEVHLVWVVGRSMESVGHSSQKLFRGYPDSFVTWLGHDNLLYRRKAPVQESFDPESISYRKKR